MGITVSRYHHPFGKQMGVGAIFLSKKERLHGARINLIIAKMATKPKGCVELGCGSTINFLLSQFGGQQPPN